MSVSSIVVILAAGAASALAARGVAPMKPARVHIDAERRRPLCR
jgi:hypothetical protein